MLLPQSVRLSYEKWLRDVMMLTEPLANEGSELQDQGEDLGDYVEVIYRLLTFAPRAPIHAEGESVRYLPR